MPENNNIEHDQPATNPAVNAQSIRDWAERFRVRNGIPPRQTAPASTPAEEEDDLPELIDIDDTADGLAVYQREEITGLVYSIFQLLDWGFQRDEILRVVCAMFD